MSAMTLMMAALTIVVATITVGAGWLYVRESVAR